MAKPACWHGMGMSSSLLTTFAHGTLVCSKFHHYWQDPRALGCPEDKPGFGYGMLQPLTELDARGSQQDWEKGLVGRRATNRKAMVHHPPVAASDYSIQQTWTTYEMKLSRKEWGGGRRGLAHACEYGPPAASGHRALLASGAYRLSSTCLPRQVNLRPMGRAL